VCNDLIPFKISELLKTENLLQNHL
jgi:hypothetical protein